MGVTDTCLRRAQCQILPSVETHVASTLFAHNKMGFLGKLLHHTRNHSGGRQSRHTFWGTHHGIFIGFLYFPLCCKRMVSEFNLQREMRKTENEQEGAHKTTQAGHSANPFTVSGCLFTAFYQVIILGLNLSDKLPLGKFSIINEKDAGFRGEKCYPWRCEMYVCCICSSFFAMYSVNASLSSFA